MANMPPRKMQLMLSHPNKCPAKIPNVIMQNTMVTVAMRGADPILRIFLNEKSRPKENKVNMMPMVAHISMSLISSTVMKSEKLGPTKNPATIYPRTRGCLSHLKMMVTMPATIKMSARSLTRMGKSAMMLIAELYKWSCRLSRCNWRSVRRFSQSPASPFPSPAQRRTHKVHGN